MRAWPIISTRTRNYRDEKRILNRLTRPFISGDGLYIDDMNHGRPNKEISRDIFVRDCVFDRNYRQGLSVISVINLQVERCTFSNTNGTDPQAGESITNTPQ